MSYRRLFALGVNRKQDVITSDCKRERRLLPAKKSTSFRWSPASLNGIVLFFRMTTQENTKRQKVKGDL